MSGQINAPIIIKRKKVVAAEGHHGGAWKVAYADFVTAMMAFFMLMWLLNATTEKQRKGLADYFNPTIPVNRISGGGDGVFSGDSVFTEDTLAHNGSGGNTDGNQKGEIGQEDQKFTELDAALKGHGGESMATELEARHIVTRITDEGLVVVLRDIEGSSLFADGTSQPEPILIELLRIVNEVFDLAINKVAVSGYVRSQPIVLAKNPNWDLSTQRAHTTREALEALGMPAARIARVTGWSDRKPEQEPPIALENNRVEITLLREKT